MWKKEEGQTATHTAEVTPRTAPQRAPSSAGSSRATIGPSISIRGDVTGSEDLLIQGTVDGSIVLGDHAVGVGSEGRVTADITGRIITVEGRVEGDLTAQEQIVLRGTAQVRGDIKAPRVVLEDGATFRGLVDMGMPAADSKASAATPSAKSSAESSGNGKAEAAGDAKSEPTAKTGSSAKPSPTAEASEAVAPDAKKKSTAKSA